MPCSFRIIPACPRYHIIFQKEGKERSRKALFGKTSLAPIRLRLLQRSPTKWFMCKNSLESLFMRKKEETYQTRSQCGLTLTLELLQKTLYPLSIL
jgi:hypothetical protein